MYRKGQNVRFFIEGAVVAEETNLSRTRGVNTEDGANKDLAADSTGEGLGGQNPVAMSKSQTFQVEAQGAGAKALFLTCLGLMNAQGGAVGWADTSGSGNRSPESSVNYVQAICNDLTINAPNRQPCTCSAQFVVISDTVATPTSKSAAAITHNILRGEFLRLFLTGQTDEYIALATNVSLHVSLSMENATTKDVTSSVSSDDLTYESQEPTTLSYDITSDCLYDGGLGGLEEGTTYAWELADASGESQQTKGTPLVSGTAMLTSLATNAPVNQNVTHSGTFTGIGLFDEQSEGDTDTE